MYIMYIYVPGPASCFKGGNAVLRIGWGANGFDIIYIKFVGTIILDLETILNGLLHPSLNS